jgi:hypothetical protein
MLAERESAMRARILELERRNAFLEDQLSSARQLSSCGTSERQTGIEVTSSAIFARLQVLHLHEHTIPIQPNRSVVIEIGASDRDTMDVEFLPHSKSSFLITCEPVVDKYARALARNAKGAGDAFQKLGHHHSRGIVLPIAVGPRELRGVQKLNLGRNSGCSSLLSVDKASNRLGFCRMTFDTREVPTITLEMLLGWVNRTVDFIKVDAQGLDVATIQSAYSRIGQVQSFAMEVVSDACDPIYAGQPKCSTVLSSLAALGFKPVTSVDCVPRYARKIHNKHKSNAFECELDVLFVRSSRDVTDPGAIDDVYWQYHNLGLNGCESLYPANATKTLATNPPPGKAVFHFGPAGPRFFGTGRGTKIDKFNRGATFSTHSYGMPYICNEALFAASASVGT